jgi:predicted secreted protein
MKPVSVVAIYVLFWTISFFLVIPFGVRTDEEVGVETSPGHADSAPHKFDFRRAALHATLVSATIFTLFYLNYVHGWVDVNMLDWASPPR